MKRYTILFELRSGLHPRRLKVEIRRKLKDCDYQEKLAITRTPTL